jgi:hypothetical protein
MQSKWRDFYSQRTKNPLISEKNRRSPNKKKMAKQKKKAKFEVWSNEEIATLIDAVFQHGNAHAKLHSAMLKKDKKCTRSKESVKLKLKYMKNAFDVNSEEKVKAMMYHVFPEIYKEKLGIEHPPDNYDSSLFHVLATRRPWDKSDSDGEEIGNGELDENPSGTSDSEEEGDKVSPIHSPSKECVEIIPPLPRLSTEKMSSPGVRNNNERAQVSAVCGTCVVSTTPYCSEFSGELSIVFQNEDAYLRCTSKLTLFHLNSALVAYQY